MIYAQLSDAEIYKALSPRFRKGFDFLQKNDLSALEPGKHAIDGDDVFVIIMDYSTKSRAECDIESHRKYADIQFMVRGAEIMKVAQLSNQPRTMEYDPERDVAFYACESRDVLVEEGFFTVFFPHDLHGPCVEVDRPREVRKAVVKVLI